MTTLPEKPSALIRLALDDLRKVERDERYGVYMGEWHVPRDSGTCEVCLAGAVMAMSLGANIQTYSMPSDFQEQDQATTERLLALNNFRSGHIADGLCVMRCYSSRRSLPNYMFVPNYHTDHEDFYVAMEKMADMLERASI